MIYLTYVGSFPLKKTYKNLIHATNDVLSIPVDYPNYIQLEDMIHQFLKPVSELECGIISEGEKYKLNGDLKIPKKPIATDSLKLLFKIMNNHPNKEKIKGIKANITGPFTLASNIKEISPKIGFFGDTVLSDPSLVKEIALIVAKIAENYYNMGTDYITIDDPMLSIIIGNKILLNQYTDNNIIDIINQSFKNIICLKGIHICGKISRRLSQMLLQTDVNILDHEFKDNESNFNSYRKSDFDLYNKKIGFSVVSSKTINVESVSEIKLMLKKGFEFFGKENISMIKPDCGFRGLNIQGNLKHETYLSSIEKLRNIRIAIDSLK